jgi:hypothetical protein
VKVNPRAAALDETGPGLKRHLKRYFCRYMADDRRIDPFDETYLLSFADHEFKWVNLM